MMNVACLNGAKKNTPETVTEQFSKAFYTADITHQYQYSTKKCVCVAKVNGQLRSDKWELLKEDGEWKVTLVMP